MLPIASRLRGWKSVRRLALIASIVVTACLQSFGLDPRAALTQYAHLPWRVGERGLEASPQSIAQTKDGYLWIGTKHQLYRFDGTQFTPLPDPRARSPYVEDTRFLFAASDGALYISSRSYGVFRWHDGTLQKIGRNIFHPGPFAEDSSGTIWFTPGRFENATSICQISQLQEQCADQGENGLHGPFASLLLAPGGARWLGGENRLVHWVPGQSPQVFPLPEKPRTSSKMVVAIESGKDGTIFAGIEDGDEREGLIYVRQNKVEDYIVPGLDGRKIKVRSLFTDAAGGLWIGTAGDGLYRMVGSRVDHISSRDGLTGDVVNQIFEDHEGSIWVVTPQGLDQFYDLPVLSYGGREGLAGASIRAVAATASGDEVWAGGLDGLYILDASGTRTVRHVAIPEIGSVEDLYRDVGGRMWVAGKRRLAFYKDGGFQLVRYKGDADVGTVVELSEDAAGDLWVITLVPEYGSALNHIRNGAIIERYDWPKSLGQDTMSSISVHPGAGLWLVTVRGLLYWFHDGNFEPILSEGAGFGLVPDREGSWAYPANDLLRLQDGRTRTLKLGVGSAANSVLNMINDGHGSLWLYMSSGLVRVRISDIQRWWGDETTEVPGRLFDSSDGVFSGISTSRPAVSNDGQVWFSNGQNLQKIDPRRIPQNVIAPPVHIETVAADGQPYSTLGKAIALPSNVKNLEIHYSALSFVKPDNVKFRYRLLGLSHDWLDAGNRRQAIYNNLAPGKYTFQVVAANSDETWNNAGAALDFSVAPAWFQTKWFLGLCVLSGALLIWACYRLRVQQIHKSLSALFDERLAERTRMARDLHDTFLQTIQGSKLVADNALKKSDDPERMRHAVEQLSVWLGQATQEGRAVLNSLRTSTTPKNDLAESFRRATEDCRLLGPTEASFSVAGDSKEMHPVVRDEIYRIGYEAIRNACMHSKGSRLEVELKYGNDLVLLVIDNGVGIDPTMGDHGKEGHLGLRGMRERTARIGGKLTIVSSAGAGTEITVVVPGGIVFREPGTSPLDKIRTILRNVGSSAYRK
jgi:signal transduction histidine kinase/ligand-binding sensor domain-containing protein